MKRLICLAWALLLAPLCALPLPSSRAEERLSIIAVNFPSYDFARVLVGDTADVRMLLPPGSESHSYEPGPRDMIAIQNADLFLYTGGESDAWVTELLEAMGDQRPLALRLTDCVTLLEEEASRSMMPEAARDPHETSEPEAEMDEHVWTSPKNAKRIVRALCKALCSLAPERANDYEAALDAYLRELDALDALLEDIVATGKRRLIIFGDRFPFRYLAAAYGLSYDAAFPGCSEDSEPSVRTVISLVNVIREQEIPVIFYIEFSSRRTADILAEETGAKPMLLHSCHNISADELAAGASYLSLMHQNAQALKEALN